MIFHQYITHFVLESLQKAHSCSYLYTSYVSCTLLKTYFFAFDKSNIPGFSPNFRFRKPVLKFAFNHNTTFYSIYSHHDVAPSGFIYLFGVYIAFQTVHIKTCSWKGRGNQYSSSGYCKLPTNGVMV